MARPKEDKAHEGAPPAPVAETGFAALEAKVEEVQTDAAVEAELEAEDAALAAAEVSPELAPIAPRQSVAATAPAQAGRPAWAGSADMASIAEPFLGAARLQADTLGRLARARGLHDVFDAQVQYGRGLVDLYVASTTRLLRLFTLPTALGGGR